jgi:hypothetical protein
VRKSGLILVLALLFLPFGVPHWLHDDGAPAGSDADAALAKLCRDHGGTPRKPPGSGTGSKAQRVCTVRYGGHVYVMDAITPDGFDEDTARYQRQGCDEARRAQRASTPRGHRRQSFTYHATTGVCERHG